MGCEDLGWKKILEIMLKEAEKRKAPVMELNFENNFQHLIFALMSSRTRDENTAKAAKKLFSVAKTAEELGKMPVNDIEEKIKSVGFYRVKARRIKEVAEILSGKYRGKIPSEFDELVKLPGIGRKTANIILTFMGKQAIAVDTHVHRISNRMGFVKTNKPEETELRLKQLVPGKFWVKLNRAFVGYGQTVCKPLKPLCSECKFNECCPKVGVRA